MIELESVLIAFFVNSLLVLPVILAINWLIGPIIFSVICLTVLCWGWVSAGVSIFSLIYPAQLALGTSLTSSVLRYRKASALNSAVVLTVVYLVIVAYDLSRGESRRRELNRFMDEMPTALIPERLAYERQNGDRDLDREAPLSASAKDSLEFEFSLTDSLRNHLWSRMIHREFTNEFIRAAGFGYVRMLTIREEYFDLTPIPELKFPDSKETDYPRGITAPPESRLKETFSIAGAIDFVAMLNDSRRDFLKSQRMGFVKPDGWAIGFQPHHFQKFPTINRKDKEVHRQLPRGIQLQRIELVSLLKFEGPRVYLTDELPRMDRLSLAASRSLDHFEQSSLDKLTAGEELIVERTFPHIRMLGGLRANKSCLKCHQASQGELLGALSYLISVK